MHKFRYWKKISISLIILTQLVLLTFYFHSENETNNLQKRTSLEKVTFIATTNITSDRKRTYHLISDKISLGFYNTRDSYVDFNTSLCFINGTDVRAMRKGSDLNWNCKCLPKWHGKDCSQPEAIWRALLAYRKPITIRGPRKYQRRIIYLFQVNQYSEAIAEIRINELNDIVDLFVIFESENNEYSFDKKLNKGFLKDYHTKMLYLKSNNIKESLMKIQLNVKNLNEDDIILINEENVIPNKLALVFFKYYNNWPEPLSFRLRWSVYGFFWKHPLKTNVQGYASRVRYLYGMLGTDLSLVKNTSAFNNTFTIGDLNHYGGWYCELCNDPDNIMKMLLSDTKYLSMLESLEKKKIDSDYIEELIENGVYVDTKTQLIRGHRFNENYFAPTFVSDHSWKYDYLLINMYSKLDYYQ